MRCFLAAHESIIQIKCKRLKLNLSHGNWWKASVIRSVDVKSNSHWRSPFHSDVYRKVCSNNRQNHKSFAYILVRIRILQLCVCHIPTKRIVSSVQVYIGSVSCSSLYREISDVLRRLIFLSNWNVLSKTWASVEFCVCTCRTHSIRLYVNVILFHQNFLVFFHIFCQ